MFESKVVQDQNSIKWKDSFSGGEYEGTLPLWIADMDYRIAEPIIERTVERAKQGVYGYTEPSEAYFNSIIQWAKTQWNTDWKKEWISPVPGVVTATNIALETITNDGDGVLLQTPIYHPFYSSIKSHDLNLICSPLVKAETGFEINFEDLEAKLAQSKVMILCNPHNPTGKVYTKNELEQIVNLANKYNVYIISDEIHADIVYKPAIHHSLLSVLNVDIERTIVLNAPSKTFNIAGLSSSYFVIPSKDLYKKCFDTQQKNGSKEINLFGLVGTEAAYTSGLPWQQKTLAYLQDNRDYALDWIDKNLPSISVISPQGTYFLWLDFRQTPISETELFTFLLEKAKIRVSPGEQFGVEGQGFARLNIACHRDTLIESLQRIQKAFASK